MIILSSVQIFFGGIGFGEEQLVSPQSEILAYTHEHRIGRGLAIYNVVEVRPADSQFATGTANSPVFLQLLRFLTQIEGVVFQLSAHGLISLHAFFRLVNKNLAVLLLKILPQIL